MFMYIAWIFIAALVSFIVSAFFAGVLKLKREVYLIFYIPIILTMTISFFYVQDIDVSKLISHNLITGLVIGGLISTILIMNVLKQPSSEKRKGLSLIIDIIWPGLIYGFTDAVLLTVLPVLSILKFFNNFDLDKSFIGTFIIYLVALLASALITALYHLGYPEFRNKKVFWTIFGNSVMSLAFLVAMNPLAAIIPHILMHITAMIHGRETTGQVPPHYQKRVN